MTQQFNGFGSTLNSGGYAAKPWCNEQRPCRRLSCLRCMKQRRDYFVEVGGHFTDAKGLTVHCGVSAITGPYLKDSWWIAYDIASTAARALTGKIGPFVRVLSVDYKAKYNVPHVHYIIKNQAREIFKETLEAKFKTKNNFRAKPWVLKRPVHDTAGLLGYFFDQNFLPAARDPGRIKGLRIFSGSRGLSYGYPSPKEWQRYLSLRYGGGQ